MLIKPPKAYEDNIALNEAGDAVVILDQSLLPNSIEYIELNSMPEMLDAIKELKVRGAPAIGICAAYCLYVLALSIEAADGEEFVRQLNTNARELASARPTAVNLGWALGRMMNVAEANIQMDTAELIERLRQEALAIHMQDIRMCMAISEHGLSLLKDGDGILTHCNAGPLATSRYGTALGPILLGTERGMRYRVFADETRPLLQGARLTTYELHNAGVDVVLICDNMAATVMKNGWVQSVMVGCDRVAANGDTANKVGTSGLAILAKHYGIPFYVLGPTSTIDMACPTGTDIEIELRDPSEISRKLFRQPIALPEISCYNPAFDVTDNELITSIITEHGICRPPYTESLSALFQHGECI